ncbi:hypothetical protein ACQPW3_11375 [Actinosynnema sp. CA-248983]
MRTAETLRGENVGWDHSRVYIDPTTGKIREIDLVGYIDLGRHGEDRIATHVIFECKHSKDKPWVVFVSPRAPLTKIGFVRAVPVTGPLYDDYKSMVRDKQLQNLSFFRAPELCGFNLVRAHTENQDAAFHAMRGTIGAALATARDIGQYGHKVLYPPVIVVDAPILQCFLPGVNEELRLTEVKWAQVLVNFGDVANDRPGHYMVHVVHIDELSKVVRDFKSDTVKLQELIKLRAVGQS